MTKTNHVHSTQLDRYLCINSLIKYVHAYCSDWEIMLITLGDSFVVLLRWEFAKVELLTTALLLVSVRTEINVIMVTPNRTYQGRRMYWYSVSWPLLWIRLVQIDWAVRLVSSLWVRWVDKIFHEFVCIANGPSLINVYNEMSNIIELTQKCYRHTEQNLLFIFTTILQEIYYLF